MGIKSLEMENGCSEKKKKASPASLEHFLWTTSHLLSDFIKGARLKSGHGPSAQPFSMGPIVAIYIS